MKWTYSRPIFEYNQAEIDLTNAWLGHRNFAYDLVSAVQPKNIVELGTHYGTSFFSMCQAVKDKEFTGVKLTAIDTWKGDHQASYYGEEVYSKVQSRVSKYYSNLSIKLIRKTFDEAVLDFNDKSIDLLHIDGLHTYEAVSNDFKKWYPKVSDTGIILFHDIHTRQTDFGVYKLWDEIKNQYPTLEFYHSYGLGLLFKDARMRDAFADFENIWQEYYSLLEDYNKRTEDVINSSTHISNLDERYKILEGEKQALANQILEQKQLDHTLLLEQEKIFFERYEKIQQEIIAHTKLIEEQKNLLQEKESSVSSLRKSIEEYKKSIQEKEKIFSEQYASIKQELSIQAEKYDIAEKDIVARDSMYKSLKEELLVKEEKYSLEKKEILDQYENLKIQNTLFKNEISNRDFRIREIEEVLNRQFAHIAWMNSSKFWKFRNNYIRTKWALLNPLKFTKKYIWKHTPTFPQIKWALANPIKFIKKYTSSSYRVDSELGSSSEIETTIRKPDERDISVIVHLYYTDMWEEIREKLTRIPYEYNLIVSFTKDHHSEEDIKKIKKFKPNANILITENKGLDVLPFLKSLRLVPKTTKYILKIQPKKVPHTPEIGDAWFQDLMKHVLPSGKGAIDMILNDLEKTEIGMIGGSVIDGCDRTFTSGEEREPKLDSKYMELILDYFNETDSKYKWISGTIFWTRFDLIAKLADEKFISFFEKHQDSGYSKNDTLAHGLERYFGKLVYDAGKIISLTPKNVSPKNILFISHDNSMTGGPKIVFEIAEKLSEDSSYVVTMLCSDIGENQENKNKRFLERINETYKVNTEYCNVFDENVISEMVRKHKPDLIYANTALMWKWVRHAKENNIPYVFHILETKGMFKEFGQDCIDFLSSVDSSRTVAISNETKNDLDSFGLINPALIPVFINTEKIDSLNIKQETLPKGLNIKKPIVLYVGSVAYRKGTDIFMEAAKAFPDLQFLCVGGIYDEGILSKELPKNFFYVGQTKNPYYYMSVASLFVLPSREEPFGIVALEALYMNKPVVCFSEGVGCSTIVKSLGYVLPGKSNALDLIKFIDNFDFSIQPKKTSELVKKEYSTNAQIPKIEYMIKEGINNHKDKIDLGIFNDKKGLEIGGPSEIFTNLIPVYEKAAKVDGVNFSEKTLWDSRKAGIGQYAYTNNKVGDQYILEATELSGIRDGSYDFLLSSHNLEHVANPIKAVKEWIRVLKPGSPIVIIVPNKEECFDHNREYTSFEHVLLDYKNDVGEDDMTHFDEIMLKHDLSMDPAAGTFKQFKKRSLDNISNRALHHHVFSPDVMKELFDFLGISIQQTFVNGIHIVCVGVVPKNNFFIEEKVSMISIENQKLTKLGSQSIYARVKWAILNPIKFAKKYFGKRSAPISDPYDKWIHEVEAPFKNKIFSIRKSIIRNLKYTPKISVIIPTYNSDVTFLKKAIKSVTSQWYPNWELCIVDDCSKTGEVLSFLKDLQKKNDPRIKILFSEKQGGISISSNKAVAIATGDYLTFLDHDDEIEPHALLLFILELQKNPKTDIFYSDIDKITVEGKRNIHDFRPDWSPELLLSTSYITHFNMVRKDLFLSLGGFHTEMNGSQDYDFFLRATEQTNKIVHVPWILYHWRTVPGSTAISHDEKSYANDAGLRALSEALKRRSIPGTAAHGFCSGKYKIVYDKSKIHGKVTIIIPTKNNFKILKKCVESIKKLTTYPEYEILVVDNGSTDLETLSYLNRSGLSVLSIPTESFNFAHLNNKAVEKAQSEYVVFLNDDTEVINPDWLFEMVGTMKIRPQIGVVGAKLLYPNGSIQHAGVILLHKNYIATHVFRGLDRSNPGYAIYAEQMRNYSAVTAACMMVRKDVFQKIGAFNEKDLAVAYNDLDLCLRMKEAGYDSVYNPQALLYHHESYSRDPEVAESELAYIRKKHISDINPDPFYNPHLRCEPGSEFSLVDGNLDHSEIVKSPAFYGVDGKIFHESNKVKDKFSYLKNEAISAYRRDGLKVMLVRVKNYLIHGKGKAVISKDYDQKSMIEELKNLKNLKDKKIPSIPPKTKPLVSIIITAHNQLKYTIQCLKSIAYANTKIKFEVIVINDASTDATHKTLSVRNDIKYFANDVRRGLAESRNYGASKAQGEYIYFLDADSIVLDGWLDSSMNIISKESSVGIVSSKLLYPDNKLRSIGGKISNQAVLSNHGNSDDSNKPEYNFVQEIDYSNSSAMILKKKIFDKVGGFDLNFSHISYKDADLSLSVRKLGLKVFSNPFSRIVSFETVIDDVESKNDKVVFKNKWEEELSKPRSGNVNFSQIYKKRILIIDRLTPTTDQDAGSVYMFYMMKIFLGLNYHVTFIPCVNLSYLDKYTQAMQEMGVESLYSPYLAGTEDFLKLHGGEYDIVMLVRAPTAFEYLDSVKLYCPQAKTIFNTIDLHYLRAERHAIKEVNDFLIEEAGKLKTAELSIVEKVDRTIVVSSAEKDLIKKEIPNARVEVVHLIRDIPRYSVKKKNKHKCEILFVGGFNHLPNIDAINWFSKEIFPIVLKKIPEAKLHIVGSNITSEIQSLSSDSVKIHGYLSEKDLNSLMENMSMTIAPIRFGAGQKGKVLHSLSMGIPCVTTSVGSEGMNIINRKEALIADHAQDFADMIFLLSKDEDLWRKISKNGYDLVKKEFGIESGIKSIESLIKNLDFTENESAPVGLDKDKEKFRQMCIDALPEVRKKKLPDIFRDQKFEAVITETRELPHVEYIIRNAVMKLGSNWSFTVLCGDGNYKYMKDMCALISLNIKVINLGIKNLSIDEYSRLMTSAAFWNMFHGEKILIYQEDSFIFNDNINEFLKWDYIGAPWPKLPWMDWALFVNENYVGNGGLSLRTRSVMLDVIEKYPIKAKSEEFFSQCKDEKYKKYTILFEDIYFSHCIHKYNLGKVATHEEAQKFSVEYIDNSDPFGGHCFWYSKKDWEDYLVKKIADNNITID